MDPGMGRETSTGNTWASTWYLQMVQEVQAFQGGEGITWNEPRGWRTWTEGPLSGPWVFPITWSGVASFDFLG